MTVRHFAKAIFRFLFSALLVLAFNSASYAQEPGLIQITNSPGENAMRPNWSPQGNAISFITNRGSGNGYLQDVWSVAPDGSNATRLTVFLDCGAYCGSGASEALWLASTGDLVVYDTNWVYEWMRFELSQNPPLPVQRNVRDGASPYFQEMLVIPGGLGGDSFAVSQNGQLAGWSVRITPNGACPFISNAAVSPLAALDGQSATATGTVLATATLNCNNGLPTAEPIEGVSFSPDGSRFVVSQAPDPNYQGFDLEIYNASGGLVRKLTNNGGGPNPVTNWNPSWSPDGTRIAFASNMSGQFQIYIINPDGTNLTPVTTGGGDWPTWSPDSSTIAFQSTRGGNSEIYSVPSVVSAPPANLSATVGDRRVILYWNTPASVPDGYNVYADQVNNDGTTVPLGQVNLLSGPVKGQHYVVQDIPALLGPPFNGVLYRFKVTAVYSAVESGPALILAMPNGFVAPPRPLHPILFLHGIDANADNTWATAADYLATTLHWVCGGTMSYSTTDKPAEGDMPRLNDPSAPTPVQCGPNQPFLRTGDYFTANFGEALADYPLGQGTYHQGIYHQGDEVGGFIKELHNAAGLSLVAHSMGGLAARSFIQVSGLFSPDQIKDLVTLGTPHWGVDRDYIRSAGTDPSVLQYLEWWRPDWAITLGSVGLEDMDGACVADDPTDPNTGTMSPFLQKLNLNAANQLPTSIRYVVLSGGGVSGYLYLKVDPCAPSKSIETDLIVPVVSSTLTGLLPYPQTWFALAEKRNHLELTHDVPSILCALDPRCLLLKVLSPVDIQVTAPDGNAISKGATSMPGAEYSIVTEDTGHDIVTVIIPFPQGGQYTVTATPKAGAQPTDTFTILQIQGGVTTTIAQDMPIQNIPPAGFQTTVQSGSSFMQVSPVSVDFGNVRVSRARKIVVTLKNTSATRQSLGPFSLTVTGGNASDFSIHPWCEAEIGPGKECTIAVHFTPQAVEAGTATLSIVTSASTVPLEVPITGSGIGK